MDGDVLGYFMVIICLNWIMKHFKKFYTKTCINIIWQDTEFLSNALKGRVNAQCIKLIRN